MKKVLLLVSIALLICLCSCATIMESDIDTILINSNPDGATVKVDGMKRGETPLSLQLEPSRSYLIEISKDGYETQYANVGRKIRVGYQALDILLTGIIGNVVDIVTPNGWQFSPDVVYVDLTKE